MNLGRAADTLVRDGNPLHPNFLNEMAMRDAQGYAFHSSRAPLEPSDSPMPEQPGRLTHPETEAVGASVAVPCIDNPAKDCILCPEFDECAFSDRRSSLNSVAFALIATAVMTMAFLLWFLLH